MKTFQVEKKHEKKKRKTCQVACLQLLEETNSFLLALK